MASVLLRAATRRVASTAAPVQMLSSFSSPSSWVILGRIPRVSADLSLALSAPPRVSTLAIPPRLFPDPVTPDNFPAVLAIEPSAGVLLLHADQGRATGPTVVDRPGDHSFCWREFVPGYFVLDATSASALALPDPDLILHPGHIGILASPASGYMVAELQSIIGGDHATLLCFSSDLGRWVKKRLHYPLPPRILAPNGVVAHHGRLWWVDLSWGLITCDPFADAPVLDFVPLPPAKALQYGEAWGVLDRYRAVSVSAGKLRFVDMYTSGGCVGDRKVGVWTLADPDSTEWTLEHEARFADIWAHPSYKAAGLPDKIPVLALIHPKDPAVVYFFLEEHLFGVDLRSRSVVEREAYELVAPPRDHVATRFVHAWELPRAISSASVLMNRRSKDQTEENLSPTSMASDMKNKD
ncbi:hypothetical protein ACP70R_030780 [Stipagrostis hirtigluma subsp. patula]